MKKLLIFAVLFATTSILQAQQGTTTSQADWSPELYQMGKKYSGYIINLDGDTVQGYIKALRRTNIDGMGVSNQNRVLFFVKESDKKPVEKYKPSELKGYKIADKVYESINYSGGLLKKPNFNLVVQEGKIRMYEWYSTKEGFSGMRKQSGESWEEFDQRRYETNLIIAKDPKEPINYSFLGLGFAKKMPPIISDHEELAKKVANKEKGYKWLNMFEVIKEYNAWAKDNN